MVDNGQGKGGTGTQKKKTLAVLTSGGDAQGMNAAIRAIVRKAYREGIVPYAILHGYDGLVKLTQGQEYLYEDKTPFNKKILDVLEARDVGNILHLGGSLLGCARCKEFQEKKELRTEIADELRRQSIDVLVVIGGNGSLTGAYVFNHETDFPVVGIPASIDNNISGTDYSLGFQTAVNCCAEQVTHLRQTASALRRLLVVQVMGAESGQLALAIGLATGAEKIILPECEALEERCEYGFIEHLSNHIKDLNRSFRGGKRQSIIVVAEGAFGRSIDGTACQLVGDMLVEKLHYEVRTDIIGYIQRGTPPVATDISLGTQFGVKAVEIIKDMFGQNDQIPSKTQALMIVTKEGEIEALSMPDPATIVRRDINMDQLALAMELA